MLALYNPTGNTYKTIIKRGLWPGTMPQWPGLATRPTSQHHSRTVLTSTSAKFRNCFQQVGFDHRWPEYPNKSSYSACEEFWELIVFQHLVFGWWSSPSVRKQLEFKPWRSAWEIIVTIPLTASKMTSIQVKNHSCLESTRNFDRGGSKILIG